MCRSTEKVQVLQCLQEQQHPGGVLLVNQQFFALNGTPRPVVARVSTLLMVVVFLVLAGCAGQPAAEPEPRVVRVEVPIQVPCRVKAPTVPAWAAEGLRKEDSLEMKVRALLAERRQRIGYERELVAAVASCQ